MFASWVQLAFLPTGDRRVPASLRCGHHELFDDFFKPVIAALCLLSIEAFGGELALGAIPRPTDRPPRPLVQREEQQHAERDESHGHDRLEQARSFIP